MIQMLTLSLKSVTLRMIKITRLGYYLLMAVALLERLILTLIEQPDSRFRTTNMVLIEITQS
jgi:hypothetical protein